MMKLALVAGVCGITLMATSGVASAMAPPPCVNAKMLPALTTGSAPTISIPANLPGFGYTALKAAATDVHLTKITGGSTEVPLTLGGVNDGLLKLTPATPLTVGSSYTLTWSAFCNGGGAPGGPQEPFKFAVVAESPIPTKIGTASRAPVVTTKDFGTTQYEIDAGYTFDAEMKPWLAVYELFIVLDGKVVATKPVLNGTNSVDVKATGWCDAANGQTKSHKIQLRAKLPFAPVLDTVSADVPFDCPAPAINAPPGVKPGSAPTKNGTTGSGTGTGTGSGTGSGTGTGTGTPASSSSGETHTCTVSHVGSSPTTGSASSALIVGLGLLAFRRRRADR